MSSPFLNIGITLAILSLSGNIPVQKAVLLVNFCSTLMCFIDRLSIPLLVFGVRLLITFNKWFSSTC